MNKNEINYDSMMNPEKILNLHNELLTDIYSVLESINDRVNSDASSDNMFVKLALIDEVSILREILVTFFKYNLNNDFRLIPTDPEAFMRNHLVQMQAESNKLQNIKILVRKCWSDSSV